MDDPDRYKLCEHLSDQGALGGFLIIIILSGGGG